MPKRDKSILRKQIRVTDVGKHTEDTCPSSLTETALGWYSDTVMVSDNKIKQAHPKEKKV